MTKEEILAMEAGDELDLAVAYGLGLPQAATVNEMLVVYYYSTDISAAWPVAEKLGLAVFQLNNGDWACCKANHLYRLEIAQDHYADPNLVICKQAPEAICKAALLAKLEKVKHGNTCQFA